MASRIWKFEGLELIDTGVSRMAVYAALLFNKIFYPETFKMSSATDMLKYTTPDRIFFQKGKNGICMEWNWRKYLYYKSLGKEYSIPSFLQ